MFPRRNPPRIVSDPSLHPEIRPGFARAPGRSQSNVGQTRPDLGGIGKFLTRPRPAPHRIRSCVSQHEGLPHPSGHGAARASRVGLRGWRARRMGCGPCWGAPGGVVAWIAEYRQSLSDLRKACRIRGQLWPTSARIRSKSPSLAEVGPNWANPAKLGQFRRSKSARI